MKKRMFSKFSSILQHAVDALAPQLSLQEEFIFHWKAVTGYFIDNKGEKVPVEQTNIPAHLEQMLVILQEEEMSSERGMYGPCLEYLLQHKLLETLYSLGRADYPPGMKQIVLSFFTKLLSRIKQPILAHVNVYKAVQRLVNSCGEVQAAPTEIEEIQFLCTVCAKIKADPYLVNFFLEMPKSTANSANIPVVEEPVSGAGNKLFQEFKIVNTLLTLSHSADSRVAVKACEGLILCSSLPEPIAAHCMINSTKFCKDLTQRLVDTYKKLPEAIHPADLETVQAKWGMEVVTEREDQQTFVGKRHLVSFLSWLDYCDQLIGIANPIVAEALSRTIHQKFLIPCVQQALLQASERGAITATAYLTRCLHTVCSERLLSEFVIFLLGQDRGLEKPDNRDNTVRSRLIERCNHVSEELCLVTLQLFDSLLQKDEEHILNNLVLRNLETRGYYDTGSYSNYRGLPGHIYKEFKEIVNQSETGKDCEHDRNFSKLTAVGSEGSPLQSSKKNLKFDDTDHKETENNLNDKPDRVAYETQRDDLSEKDEVKSSSSLDVQSLEKDEKVIMSIHDNVTSAEFSSSPGERSGNSCDSANTNTQHLNSNVVVSQEGAENPSEHAHENQENSINPKESSKSEMLPKAICDIDTDLTTEKSSESLNNTAEDNDNASSSIVETQTEAADKLTEKLENSAVESHQRQDVVCTDNKDTLESDSTKLSPNDALDMLEDGTGVHSISPRKSRIEVHNIVNCFLSLVPEDLKSSYQMADSGYDMYLKDAHHQYSDVLKACTNWNYPETVTSHHDKTKSEENFYEGDFLHMLLDKLAHLLDQSYPVNLQLTSVVAKLALVPHPNLHEFLLDPYLPLKPNVRSLYSVLQKKGSCHLLVKECALRLLKCQGSLNLPRNNVSNEIKSQLASQPNLGKKLVMVRRRLMSSAPNLNSLRRNVSFASWVEGQGRLEAIIVLEEFCKELSAIAFIKHHAAVTGQK